MSDYREARMWEYHFLELEAHRNEGRGRNLTDGLGKQGWELIAAYRSNAGWNVFTSDR
jgi:hypothetical protein